MDIDCIAVLMAIVTIVAAADIVAIAADTTIAIIVMVITIFVGLCSKVLASVAFDCKYEVTFAESTGS